MLRLPITFLCATFLFQNLSFAFEPVETKLLKYNDKPVQINVDITAAADLYLITTYGGDSYDCDQAIWGEPILYDNDGKAVRLTTLKPASAKTGWGKLLIDKNHQNYPLAIADEKMDFGFWAHAPSILHFKLDGKFKRLETKVGLDPAGTRGSVFFQVRSTPVPFPNESEYTQNFPTPTPTPIVPSADETAFVFNPEAANKLLEQGIEEILFIRRLTYTGNHIYTEYINSAWMPGGGLCALDLKTGNVREIVPEFTQNGVVGWFDLSFDAKKIVFDFKQGPNDGYRIYEVNADGTNLRQLTFPEVNEAELVEKYRRGYHHGTDDMEPCYLPDGGIVFASTRCQFSVLCDSSDSFTVKNLYRMNADGSNIKPLTYSALSKATPTMLSDGRILYHRWEYVDKSAGNAKALWSINPDGTGSAEVYGNTISFPETMIQAREIPGERNKIVMLGASHCCPNNAVGTVIVVDTSHHIRSPGAMQFITDDVAANHHNGFHFRDETGNWIHDFTGTPGRLFRNPYPINRSLFLVSHKPKDIVWSAPAGYDLALLDEQGHETVLLKDPTVSLWGVYPLKERTRPPVVSGSTIEPMLAAQGLARCIVTDVYVGMENVQRGDVKYIRILEQLPRPWSDRKNYGDDHVGTTHAHSALGIGMLSAKIQHGIVPVEEDGSANFVVPAGKAIYFQALDKNFCAIQTERTYVNYMPGEVRSCIGCHETPEIAVPHIDSMPKAMLRLPSAARPQRPQTDAQRVFDYERQIQPILDKHCVECHGGKEMEANLDLRGTPKETFSVSYHALNQLARTEKQLLGFRKYRDEDAAMNGIEYIPPYQTGALSSPLAAMIMGKTATTLNDEIVNQYAAKLTEVHPDLKLSEAEKLTITNWLDINCQFHPSYRGKLHARFQGESDYRPALTFDEVLGRGND